MLELRPKLLSDRVFDSLSSIYEDKDSIFFVGLRAVKNFVAVVAVVAVVVITVVETEEDD